MGAEGELVTSAEAARMLGVSEQCVSILVRRGKLPARHNGRFVLIPRAAVRERLAMLAREYPRRSGEAWGREIRKRILKAALKPREQA